ncbi:hypothetical protein VB618_15250 [Microvirga sp. CF3062]|uniref:hypothetical protein n=1 Tax=Microvirga sp. CF3062 TaxID=3110182 RepID=UPI002E77CFA3|nr:hypothetical protein [Microvirga sp. CF3062]MEE1657563.1 hypothetical protein [Microvirga sp. CF3062]
MHWFIFAGLGPLIGLTSAFLFGFTSNFLAGTPQSYDPFSGSLMDQIAGITFLAICAYIFGLIPALAAALAVRKVQIRQARHEWVWVTLMGIGIGLIFVVAFGAALQWLIPRGGSIFDIHKEAFLVYVPTCLIPTLVCWRLSRRFDKSFKPSLLS